MREGRWHCHSPEEMVALGEELAAGLPPGSLLCLWGPLGAGKTTLIKGIAAAIAGCRSDEVTSPTFLSLQIYEGRELLYHFDLYHIEGEKAFCAMGFDEYFDSEGICCIEWPERIASLLPERRWNIAIDYLEEGGREVIVNYGDK